MNEFVLTRALYRGALFALCAVALALVGLQLSALLGGNLASMPIDDLERALDSKPR